MSQEIFISNSLIKRCIDDSFISGLFVCVVLEEFGHHLEQLCFDAASVLTTDTVGDEGSAFGMAILSKASEKLLTGDIDWELTIDAFKLKNPLNDTAKICSTPLRDVAFNRFDFSKAHTQVVMIIPQAA